MLTVQTETYDQVIDYLKEMFPEHHKELGLYQDKMPLDPQYFAYQQREAAGQLMIVTVREDSNIVGYWVSFVAPGLHYQTTLCNHMDIYWVHPDHRGKKAGFMLVDKVLSESKRRGVKIIYAGSKNHKETAWFFKRLGFVPAEEIFVMPLWD